MLEFEPDFERRSSFGDAGWADHTVPDVQGHLRVHANILINGVRRHRQASCTLAFKHGVATLDGGSTGLFSGKLTLAVDRFMGERQRFREASVPIGGNVVPPALGISRNLSRVFENTIGNGCATVTSQNVASHGVDCQFQ